MRLFYLSFILSCLTLSTSLFSQDCPPPGFPNSGTNCGNPIICESLDDYCNTINNSNQARNFPCCGGWQLNNDEWFGFFAGSTTITLEITPSNCESGGQQGLQAAIYDNCPAFPPPGGWCAVNLMDAQCSCTENPFTLTATDFIIGEVYWFVIDGCSGNVCDYEIQVLEGSTQGFPPDNPGPVTGETPVCQGTTEDYELPPVNGATTYTWTLTPSGAGTINGNDDDISVAWSAGFSGTATLCVSTSNLCFTNPTQSCITVEVLPRPTATLSGSGVICAGTNGTVDLTVTLTGDPDWIFVYAIAGVPQAPITTSTSPYIITATQPGNYTLVSVVSVDSDPDCPGTVSGSVLINLVTLLPTSTTVAAICGQNNGSVNLSISGGNTPYTYIWSSGETTQDLSNVPPGTYTTTITDNNGCTATHTATVTDNITAPVLSAVITDNTTCIAGNGAIDLSVTPPTNNTYIWSSGETTQDLTNIVPGTYTVTVTQGVTCTATGSYTVADIPSRPVPTATSVQSTCNLPNGSVNASVTGGVTPYTYLWSNGATTEDLVNIMTGSYTLTVTGANGCTAPVTVNVGNNDPAINLSGTTQPNTACPGGTGSIDLTVTPPGPPYTYNWSNGATIQDQTNLLPGSYTVTVSAGGTCTASATYNVANTPNLPVPTATSVQSTCNLPNGSINASVTGGVTPYTYLWSSGQTTEDLANILSGGYTLTVTGANGCTATVTVNVGNNDPAINLSATTQVNTLCTGGNGSIDLTASPNGPPYTYIWSNGETTQDISGLTPGNYIVTVSAGGTCTASATYNIGNNPSLPIPTATPTQSTCDLPNGSINASVSGGVAPYTFLWSNGETTEDLSNIVAGSYTLTVTGANGCTRLLTVNVGNNNPPINLSATTQANTLCTGGNGSIDLTANPNGPPYTYIWSNGATTQDITNLTPGNYTVTVSAGGTCTASATYTVADNPNLPIPSATTVQSTCDLPNGSINASITGGVAPFTFVWSNGATTEDLSNIAPGSYSLTVTGANGCTRVLNVTVGNNNPPINLSATTQPNTLCTGGNGSIDLTVTPPGPPYTYVWSNGATTQDISGLPPGNYTVTVSAGGTCTASATYNVPDGPNVPIPTATTVQSTCDLPNGSINASVTGGVAPYTYLWSNGATTEDLTNILAGSYTITVTAANGCTRSITVNVTNNNPPINLSSVIVANTTCTGGNGSIDLTAAPPGPAYTYIWSNGATTQDIGNLTPGSYTVTVSAGGTCTATATYNVPDNPNIPIPTAVPTQSTCSQSNGSIDASVSGGVSPYTYVWSNGATTQDLANVPAGTYVLTVTGANGCTRSVSVDVTNNNPPITVNGTTMPNTVCNTTPNGSVNITVAPPNAGYTYLWSNGATTEDINAVPQGNYTVTVTLIGTCTQVATFTVPDNPNAPQITPTVVNTTCGFANGAINIAVNGGPTPYTYFWNPGGITTQNLSMIPAGSYQVTVTATNGCTAAADINVANNNPPINLTGTTQPNTTCNNSPNGLVNLTAGPLTNYTYIWSNGATTQDIANLPPGDYTVTVSAGGSCIEFATFTVPDLPNAPITNAFATDANCGLPNGSINLTASGGVPPYTYAWSSGQTVQDLTNITGGSYFVVVTGANGCTSQETVDVADNDIPVFIDANVLPKTSCLVNNGSISLMITPPNATILWSTGNTGLNLVNLAPGNYTVTVSAGGTCTSSETFTIDDDTENPILSADVINAVCTFTNGEIDLEADFGIPPYTYNWAHIPGPNNQQDLMNLPAGNYAVTVTTSVGCSEVLFVPVANDPLQIDINGVVSDDYSCTSNNGFIDIDVNPPVNYVYNWAHIPGPNNPPDLNDIGAGTYFVTVTYGTCNASAAFDLIDATEPPSISISPTAAICGQSNGAVTISVSGATAPYRFNWAHIPGTNDPQNLSNLAPGTYTVTVTDFFDCTATASATVVNNTIVLNISGISVKNTSCVAPNGDIDISVLPAGNNYLYTWSNGATTQDLMGIAPGIYSVTASAGVGCTSVATFQVTNNTVDPQLDPTVTAAICSQNNGNIQITTTSGTAPYNFLWSNAAITEDLNNIFPGNYSLTITDANGCTADTTLNVANNATTFSLSGTATDYSDCTSINGTVDLTVTPAGPYTYLWSGGETTQDLSNLPAGAYTVQVTESGTCIASATYFVQDERTYPTLNQSLAAELCNLSDGSIDLSVLGGLAPFSYIWASGQTTEDLINIGGGTYDVTVSGANNCSATATLNIPENDLNFSLSGTAVPNSSCVVLNGSVDLAINPATPSGGPGYTYLWSSGQNTQDLNGVSAGSYVITVSAGGTCTNTASFVVNDAAGAPGIAESVTEALCGQSSGSINLTIIGGASPYNFNWSTGLTTEDLFNIPSGNYAITVTGANGCQIVDNFDVPENVITPNLAGIPQPNTACVGHNGSINLSISPNTLTYTILWSTGATTQNLSNLSPGTYTVAVNGGGACTASASYTIDNNTQGVNATGTDLDILCFGNNTGAIDLMLSGGTQPFNFNWSPNVGNIEDPGSLTAGTYAVTITDAVGCTATTSFIISQPSALVQASCTALNAVSQPGLTDGSAQVQIGGGVAPYTVLWSPGGLQNGVPAGNFLLNNLGVGSYAVTVTDANGCTAVCGFAILLSPCTSAIGTMGDAALSLCGTGCITANYDALGQVLDPDDILQFILHLGPGSLIVGEKARSNQPTFCFNPATMIYGTTYYVSAVVGNNNGSGNVVLSHYCTVIATGTPIVFYQKPVASAAIPEPITCATLIVGIVGSSSLPNSTFLWSTTNGTIIGNAGQAGILADEAGDYTLIVNSNGCLDTTAAEVLDIRNDPVAEIKASPDDILDCIIDEIILAGEIKGSGNANTIWYDQNGVVYPGGTVLQIDNPGTYWFAIVDTITFCTDTASIEIGQNQLYPPLFINPPATLTCAIGSVTLSGGSPIGGVQFQWATVAGQDTTIVGTGTSTIVTQPNTYLLIGFDPVNGCNNALSTVVVTDQSYPTANAGPPFNIDCFGETALINGTATGGSGILTFVWTTNGGAILSGANTLTPIISEPGTYTLVVNSTGNGCSDTDVVVIAPNDPVAIPIVNNAACFGEKGSILIDTVLGAKPPIQYTLTGGPHIQSGSLFFNLSAGDYTIFIEDANGCSTSVDATVTQPPVFEVTVDPQITVQLGESYQVDATVNISLDEISQISWTPPTYLSCDTCLSTRIDTPLHTQAYRILVVTKAGCRDEAPLLLRVNKQVGVYIPNIFSPDNDDDNNRFTVYADMRGVKQVKLFQIYSRWGEQVFVRENFQPNDPTLGWDGRFRGQDMNPAVFVYYAIVEFIDGQEVLYKGDVTVKR